MNIFIYTLERTVFEGQASVITLPTENGEISVLPSHTPLVTALQKGTVRYRTDMGSETLKIANGIAYIDGARAVILAS